MVRFLLCGVTFILPKQVYFIRRVSCRCRLTRPFSGPWRVLKCHSDAIITHYVGATTFRGSQHRPRTPSHKRKNNEKPATVSEESRASGSRQAPCWPAFLCRSVGPSSLALPPTGPQPGRPLGCPTAKSGEGRKQTKLESRLMEPRLRSHGFSALFKYLFPSLAILHFPGACILTRALI